MTDDDLVLYLSQSLALLTSAFAFAVGDYIISGVFIISGILCLLLLDRDGTS